MSARLAGQARLVDLVDLVDLVCLVHLVGLVQPNKRDKPNKPNNGIRTPGDSFSTLGRINRRRAKNKAVTCYGFVMEWAGTG